MNSLAILIKLIFLLPAKAEPTNAPTQRLYPQEALQCYSTSALQSQKDGKIICPMDRNQYCIKELVNASRADCGSIPGPYFEKDVWDIRLAQCVYRKCADRCPTEKEDEARMFGGDDGDDSLELYGRLPTPVFNRTSYCCDSDLCNTGAKEMNAVGFAMMMFAGLVGLGNVIL